jgi:hypothetical protein
MSSVATTCYGPSTDKTFEDELDDDAISKADQPFEYELEPPPSATTFHLVFS